MESIRGFNFSKKKKPLETTFVIMFSIIYFKFIQCYAS